jgi:hypothetical protein
MAAVNLKVKGGAQMKAYLAAMEEAIDSASGVRVGFLENATYPAQKGQGVLYVATVAFWNEFGTSIARARPFFRQMIARELGAWGEDLGKYLKAAQFNSARAFAVMGDTIKDALTYAIASWPADNAPSTIARKGFDKGLVDKGTMQSATDFEVLG